MSEFARVGEVCPDPACTAAPAIVKFGTTAAGRQRYRCTHCRKTFSENTGTLFYNKHTPPDEIIETLALIAEGSRISSLARVKGFKQDTILSWVRQAAEQAEAVEEVLLSDYRVERAQIDGLWSLVGNKGEKKATPRPRRAANSGARR
ncbi:MAG: transposase [Rhodothermales bacterium]